MENVGLKTHFFNSDGYIFKTVCEKIKTNLSLKREKSVHSHRFLLIPSKTHLDEWIRRCCTNIQWNITQP